MQHARNLLLVTGKEKQEGKYILEKLRDALLTTVCLEDEPKLHRPPANVKLGTVGIFSRSAPSDYAWMETLLRSSELHDIIQDVRTLYISNTAYVAFFDEVRHCKFGILYHTKNRGRVNITNVTDSLYDKELQHMSTVLGRDNVIVVIDDLEDSGKREKKRILDTQPSIMQHARNLLLVTGREKQEGKYILEKLRDALLTTAADNDIQETGYSEKDDPCTVNLIEF
ncbi:uncharacterized protein LOC134943905 [Pseudophryne corroboree]|uniref:uncharacterized protein LOC134943905 n=1 Tax=Pseudophryne corroboree TaxID=495146 RepID=UPI003081D2B6